MLLSHRELVPQDAETVAEALELFRARPGFGFSDYLMVEIARKLPVVLLRAAEAGLCPTDSFTVPSRFSYLPRRDHTPIYPQRHYYLVTKERCQQFSTDYSRVGLFASSIA